VVTIHAIKVLDFYEETESEDEAARQSADRRYWEGRASEGALESMGRLIELVGANLGAPRVTYNKNHVAIGTTGRNFCWLPPPKTTSHCHVRVRVDPDVREERIRLLEETGLYVRPFQRELVTLKLATRDIEAHQALLLDLLRHCAAAAQVAE